MLSKIMTCLGLTIIFLQGGCGDVGPQKRLSKATNIGSIMESPKMLDGKEMEMAYTICLALRNKVTEFRSQHLNEKFSFEIEFTACNNSKTSTVITTTLKDSNNTLLYDSALPTFYYKNVETHTTGLMAPLCTSLLKGEMANNTYDEMDGKRQYRFSVENGRAKVSGLLAKRDQNSKSASFGQFVISREDIKIIETGPAVAGVIIGLESEQTQRLPCQDGITFESVRQLFLTHQAY